jgi:hypothetical protein
MASDTIGAVDDFGIEYTDKKHAMHLIEALELHHKAVSKDRQDALFCGITLEWDYTRRTVDLSMPGYITQTLHKFQHPIPPKLQHAPHKHNEATPIQTNNSTAGGIADATINH